MRAEDLSANVDQRLNNFARGGVAASGALLADERDGVLGIRPGPHASMTLGEAVSVSLQASKRAEGRQTRREVLKDVVREGERLEAAKKCGQVVWKACEKQKRSQIPKSCEVKIEKDFVQSSRFLDRSRLRTEDNSCRALTPRASSSPVTLSKERYQERTSGARSKISHSFKYSADSPSSLSPILGKADGSNSASSPLSSAAVGRSYGP